MLFALLSLMHVGAEPSEASRRDLCVLGHMVMADLPSGREAGSAYIETDPSRDELMKLCPTLARALPAGYLAADDDARSRAAEHAPTPGVQRPSALIVTIAIPSIAQDGRSATVMVTTECSGLCGSGTEYRYTRTHKTWRRQGKPRARWVS